MSAEKNFVLHLTFDFDPSIGMKDLRAPVSIKAFSFLPSHMIGRKNRFAEIVLMVWFLDVDGLILG